jgi:DNA-binding MarR family transcriptional regulator
MATADPRANRLGALAVAVGDRLGDEVEEIVGASGVAAAALAVIAQQPRVTIEELRQAIGRSHPAAVRIVDRLVALGLVERRPSGHGRALALVATREGRRRVRAYLRRRDELLAGLLDGVDGDEQAALDAFLRRALTRLAELPDGITVCRLCDKTTCRGEGCPVVDRLVQQGIEPPPPAAP